MEKTRPADEGQSWQEEVSRQMRKPCREAQEGRLTPLAVSHSRGH